MKELREACKLKKDLRALGRLVEGVGAQLIFSSYPFCGGEGHGVGQENPGNGEVAERLALPQELWAF